MKKTNYLLSLLMVFACLFSACDKDDDVTINPEKEIIGTWQTTGYSMIKMDGKKVNYDLSKTFKQYKIIGLIYEFKADGTMFLFQNKDDKNPDSAKWKLLNNNTQILVKYDSDITDDAKEVDIRFANGILYLTEIERYTNTEIPNDTNSGDFSFSDFDKLFSTNIAEKGRISATVEMKFIRI